ncbi:hypothetical protein [Lysobacter gummosus]|uniref:hypothetical protein n=1 Tax=Lysobacter gummosus TaxID=262324 RepID=UPI0036345A0E
MAPVRQPGRLTAQKTGEPSSGADQDEGGKPSGRRLRDAGSARVTAQHPYCARATRSGPIAGNGSGITAAADDVVPRRYCCHHA